MRNFLLAVCALVVAVLVIELVLRTTHLFSARVAWTEPDAEIGWRFTPGRDYWFFAENDHAIEGRINTMGWRDHERVREKRVDRRVVVLGDSYVEAFQVELDSTFVAVADRILNASGTGEAFEFMNFGRSGMGPAEESIVLKRDILPCAPDIVVLLFTPNNDIADVSRVTAADLLRPFYTVDEHDSLRLDTSFRHSRGYRLREFLNPLKQRSALVSLVAERYNVARLARAARQPDAGAAPRTLTREQTLLTKSADAAFLANYELAKRIVTEMARTLESKGVAFVLMSVPLVYDDGAIAQLRALDSSFDANYFDSDLAALADSSRFTFVPLTGAFSARRRESGESLHWAHWNYRGHQLVGRALADVMGQSPPAVAPRQ
jgi:hypothetical protein